MTKFFAGAAVALCVPVGAYLNNLGAPSEQEVVARVEAATVLVKLGDGLGSGFLISPDGYIVTCRHVAQSNEGDKTISVQFDGQPAQKAQLIGSDPDYDISLLRVSEVPKNAHPLEWGAVEPRLAERVLEIGHPFNVDWTLTTGIISHLHRKERFGPANEIDYTQFDAATNPGNSGGPVTNLKGEVVGVADVIISPHNMMGDAWSVGLAFMIPARQAREAVRHIAFVHNVPQLFDLH